MENDILFKNETCLVPLEELRKGVKVYPEELIPHILSNEDKVFHFVSRQL